MNKRCCIVGSADCYLNLHEWIFPNDYIVAADAGYLTLCAQGIHVDAVIGDFDSMGSIPEHPERVILPSMKDVTDTFAAAQLALNRGFREFHIFGGTGGRFDHTVANLQLLAFLSENHARGYLYGKENISTIIQNSDMLFDASYSGYISIFSYSDTASGVTLEGLKYTLSDEHLHNQFPLGTSNEFIGVPCRISVQSGKLLIVYPVQRSDILSF